MTLFNLCCGTIMHLIGLIWLLWLTSACCISFVCFVVVPLCVCCGKLTLFAVWLVSYWVCLWCCSLDCLLHGSLTTICLLICGWLVFTGLVTVAWWLCLCACTLITCWFTVYYWFDSLVVVVYCWIVVLDLFDLFVIRL